MLLFRILHAWTVSPYSSCHSRQKRQNSEHSNLIYLLERDQQLGGEGSRQGQRFEPRSMQSTVSFLGWLQCTKLLEITVLHLMFFCCCWLLVFDFCSLFTLFHIPGHAFYSALHIYWTTNVLISYVEIMFCCLLSHLWTPLRKMSLLKLPLLQS